MRRRGSSDSAGTISASRAAKGSAAASSEGQRAAIRALLAETETMLYEKADQRTRFRLKYKEYLCEV